MELELAGMMLIDFDEPFGSEEGLTAWAINGEGTEQDPVDLFGWKASHGMELEVYFRKEDFDVHPSGGFEEIERGDTVYLRRALPKGNIAIRAYGPGRSARFSELDSMLGLDELDDRIDGLCRDRLEPGSFVSSRITVEQGEEILSGELWSPDRAVRWTASRPKDHRFSSRPISSSLRIRYGPSDMIVLEEEKGEEFTIRATRRGLDIGAPRVTIRNSATLLPEVERFDGRVLIPYLLWYYRLAKWKGSKVPVYTPENRDAVVLQCDGASCHYHPQSSSVCWPPLLTRARAHYGRYRFPR